MKELFRDTLADVTLRFCRCAGDTRLHSGWKDRWPGYCFKYEFMWRVYWWEEGMGWKEKRQDLRLPSWLERRKYRKPK